MGGREREREAHRALLSVGSLSTGRQRPGLGQGRCDLPPDRFWISRKLESGAELRLELKQLGHGHPKWHLNHMPDTDSVCRGYPLPGEAQAPLTTSLWGAAGGGVAEALLVALASRGHQFVS